MSDPFSIAKSLGEGAWKLKTIIDQVSRSYYARLWRGSKRMCCSFKKMRRQHTSSHLIWSTTSMTSRIWETDMLDMKCRSSTVRYSLCHSVSTPGARELFIEWHTSLQGSLPNYIGLQEACCTKNVLEESYQPVLYQWCQNEDPGYEDSNQHHTE